MKLLLTLIFLGGFVFAQEKEIHWEAQIKPGWVYNVPSPLVIKQNGFEDIRMNAKYYSEPFKFPVYLATQIGRWADNKLWELESIHHKLYLGNKPPEIKIFTISHGFNMVMINRGWMFREGLIYRVGAGAVLAHPESEIRNLKHDETNGIFGWGYYISGPCAQTSLEYRKIFWNHLILSLSTKFTAGYVNVPVYDGRAHVTNFAFHGLFGLGYRL